MTTVLSTAPTATAENFHPSMVTQVRQLTDRNLHTITREPTLVFFPLAMPNIMLTLFGQVFKSLAQTPNFPNGVSHINCLLPAILCTTLVQSATTSSAAIATVFVALPLSFAMIWLFIWIGVLVKKPETTQIAGMLVTFPLMFASSAYVPIASLPGWLQVVAKVNPLSYTVDAARGFALGSPSAGALGKSVLIAAVLAGVSIIGATVAYRRIDH